MTSEHPGLAPDDAERLHRYLAAFLSPAAADGALGQVVRSVDRDATIDQLLAAARTQLVRRISVPRDLEVAVLIEEVGLPPDRVAALANVPRQTVDALIESEGLRLSPVARPGGGAPTWPAAPPVASDDTGGLADGADGADGVQQRPAAGPPIPPADGSAQEGRGPDQPAPTPRPDGARPATTRPRRRIVLLVAVAAAVAVIVAAVAGSTGGDGAGDSCVPTSAEPVCVTSARVTDIVDPSGTPGAPRSAFQVGEPVKLWFEFDTLDAAGGHVVDYVWIRDGRVLYASDFQLPPGGRVNLTLAQPFATDPGSYVVRVRNGDTVLVERRFSIG